MESEADILHERRRRTLRQVEQSVYVRLCAAGSKKFYMKRSEHGSLNAFFFLSCQCNPLKKLKLLEMSQSQSVCGQKKSPALHVICLIII